MSKMLHLSVPYFYVKIFIKIIKVTNLKFFAEEGFLYKKSSGKFTKYNFWEARVTAVYSQR